MSQNQMYWNVIKNALKNSLYLSNHPNDNCFCGTYLQILLQIEIKYLQKWTIAKTLKAKNCRLQKGASIGKRSMCTCYKVEHLM